MANEVKITLAADGRGLKLAVDGAVMDFDKLGKAATQSADTANTSMGATRRGVLSISEQLATAKGAVVALGQAMAAAFVLDKVYERIKEAALLNARYETLGVSMTVVGRNSGYTAQQMEDAAAGMRAMGISMIESRQQAMRLVQAHINLADSQKLARIAQDAAVIGNMNSSEAFAHMIHGIQTGQTDVLRTVGLNVSMEQSYKLMAQTLHKNVDALTQNERTQGVLNAVMLAGADIAGTYEAAMDTAGKQLNSMTRYMEDVKVKQGEVFNDLLTVGVMAFTEHLKDSNGQLDEMAAKGELKQWGIELTTVFVGIANAIDNIMTGAKMAGTWLAQRTRAGEINDKYQQKLDEIPNTPDNWKRRGEIATQRDAEIKASMQLLDDMQVELGARADRFDRAWQERQKAMADKTVKATADTAAHLDQARAAQANYADMLTKGQITQKQYLAGVALINQAMFGDNHKYSDTPAQSNDSKAHKLALDQQIAQLEQYQTAAKTLYDQQGKDLQASRQMNLLTEKQYTEQHADMLARQNTDNQAVVELQMQDVKASRLTKEQKAEALIKYNAELRKLKDEEVSITRDRERAITVIEFLEREKRRKAQSDADQSALEKTVQEVNALREGNAALALNNEEIGLTTEALNALTLKRLDAAIAQQQSTVADYQSVEASQVNTAQMQVEMNKLDALREKRDLLAGGQQATVAADAARRAREEWQKTADSIYNGLTDSLYRAFEAGKGFFKTLWDGIKNLFKTTVLKLAIQGVVGSVIGGVAGTASAGGSMLGSALGSAAGSSGLGLVGSGATGLTGIMNGLSAWGEGGSVMGVLGNSSLYSLTEIAGALGPIALGIGAAVSLLSSMDHSGTYHTGALAQYSAAGGLQTSDNGHAVYTTDPGTYDMHFGGVVFSQATADMVAGLSKSIVGILDSTALAFGKTAGYTAATAFADDSSSDGAWGGLVIKKLGDTLINWGDTRTGWAPKVFSDGASGQKEYLAALASSVREALDQIGLPDWANGLLNNLGDAPTLEQLASVVDNINLTHKTLQQLGDALTGFASLSDAANTALIGAAGGISALATSASSYYEAFYSESERAAVSGKQLTRAIEALGLEMPATKAAFRALVEQQTALGEAGAPAVASLLSLSGAFNTFVTAAETAGKAITDEITRLRGETTTDTASQAALLGQFATLTAQARSGDATARDQLPAISQALEKAATLSATSSVDVARMRGWLAGSLSETLSAIGAPVPAFAAGGLHAGGLRLVGENGPELEVTGPSRIVNHRDTRALLGGANDEMVAEMRALREEVALLRMEAQATASHTNKTARILDRVCKDGSSLQTTAAV